MKVIFSSKVGKKLEVLNASSLHHIHYTTAPAHHYHYNRCALYSVHVLSTNAREQVEVTCGHRAPWDRERQANVDHNFVICKKIVIDKVSFLKHKKVDCSGDKK